MSFNTIFSSPPTTPQPLTLLFPASYNAVESRLCSFVRDKPLAASITTVQMLMTAGLPRVAKRQDTTTLSPSDQQTIADAINTSGIYEAHIWRWAILDQRDLTATLAFMVLLFPHLQEFTIEVELFSPSSDNATTAYSGQWFHRVFYHARHAFGYGAVPPFVSRFIGLGVLKVTRGNGASRNAILPPTTVFAAMNLPVLRVLELSGSPDLTQAVLSSGGNWPLTWPMSSRAVARHLRTLRIRDASVGLTVLGPILAAAPGLEEFDLETTVPDARFELALRKGLNRFLGRIAQWEISISVEGDGEELEEGEIGAEYTVFDNEWYSVLDYE